MLADDDFVAGGSVFTVHAPSIDIEVTIAIAERRTRQVAMVIGLLSLSLPKNPREVVQPACRNRGPDVAYENLGVFMRATAVSVCACPDSVNARTRLPLGGDHGADDSKRAVVNDVTRLDGSRLIRACHVTRTLVERDRLAEDHTRTQTDLTETTRPRGVVSGLE